MRLNSVMCVFVGYPYLHSVNCGNKCRWTKHKNMVAGKTGRKDIAKGGRNVHSKAKRQLGIAGDQL